MWGAARLSFVGTPKPSALTSRLNPQNQQQDEYKAYWHPGLEDPFNALGITNVICKFREIQAKSAGRDPNEAADSAQLSESRRITIHRVVSPTPIVVANRKSQIPATIRPASSFTDDSDSHPLRPLAHVAALAGDMPRIQALQQISPPSSPEVSSHGKHSLDTVSPIDSDSDASFDDFPVTAQRDPIPSQQYNLSSSLPVATRESLRPSQATTTAAKKPLQVPLRKQKTDPVRPSTQPVFTVIPNNPGPISRNAGATSPSLGQRFKRLGKEAAHAFENRPPWKGASGREPQLKTLRDDLSVAPLNIPARSSRRAVSREGYSKPRPASLLITQPADNKTGKSGLTVRKLIPSKGVEKDARPQPKITIPTRRPSQHYPSPPPSDPIAHTAGIDTTLSQPDSPTPASNPIRRKPSPATPTSKPVPHANPLGSSPVYIPLAARGRSQSALGLVTDTSIVEEDEEQPKSHFSFTTSDQSRTNSDKADMSVIDPAPIGTPVMNRKRPLARGEYFHSSQSPALIGGAKRLPRKSDPHLRATSVSDLFSPGSGCKPLPLAPPEVSATDRIQHLDAQLFGLANRQINIERGIKKMTELMPTDYILASAAVIRRREDEKKKIEALRAELSEIQREQHELGFQRHRAYKRLDKEAQYEPTSLWVRRVAS